MVETWYLFAMCLLAGGEHAEAFNAVERGQVTSFNAKQHVLEAQATFLSVIKRSVSACVRLASV